MTYLKTLPQAFALSLLLTGGAFMASAMAQSDSLLWNEFNPRVMTDFGHVVKGDNGGNELKFLPVNRNTVILEQTALYHDWVFDAGFKGIVWWPFPPTNAPESRTIRVEPRLSIARARYAFGPSAETGPSWSSASSLI